MITLLIQKNPLAGMPRKPKILLFILLKFNELDVNFVETIGITIFSSAAPRLGERVFLFWIDRTISSIHCFVYRDDFLDYDYYYLLSNIKSDLLIYRTKFTFSLVSLVAFKKSCGEYSTGMTKNSGILKDLKN